MKQDFPALISGNYKSLRETEEIPLTGKLQKKQGKGVLQKTSQSSIKESRSQPSYRNETTIVGDENLTIDGLARAARHGALVELTDTPEVLEKVKASCKYIEDAVAQNKAIYGVTTGFGGMGDVAISAEEATELQNNLIWFLKSGAGKQLPFPDVRAAMLLRINSHLKGASGIRLQLIERMQTFLNQGVTPHVYEYGSIGASGDLVPLARITGALIGADDSFTVDFQGRSMPAPEALKILGLQPLTLHPKEGLAMTNGTSVMTAIAALCVRDAQQMLALSMGTHALFVQGLAGTNQSFHPFIHELKPHSGQKWAAATMIDLLQDSVLSRDELQEREHFEGQHLIQDRYSLRCLPQYLGPIVDGLREIGDQMEVEMNSVTDNPLIDVENQTNYHGGNFLGQYVGVGMDRLRYYLGLLAKHLDTQIALLVAPEFNNGLPPSLVGNTNQKVNMGLKGLQITGNSLMPLLTFFGNSIADRYPTHAEQFNQNINSQGFASANLTRQSIAICHQYMAVTLMFAVQGVDLRTYKLVGHYDARQCLSPATEKLYSAVRSVLGKPPSTRRPYIWNDREQSLDQHIACIAADLAEGGLIMQAIEEMNISLV